MKPITVLLLEDELQNIEDFKKCINQRSDVTLIDTTNSSYEALKIVENKKPEAVIVDIELTNGYGSGFEFLTGLKTLGLKYLPLVVITTKIKSNKIYNNIHDGFADVIFYKGQPDFSYNTVINALFFGREHPKKNYLDIIVEKSNEDREKVIKNLIFEELDKLKINHKLVGRRYLVESLEFLLSATQDEIDRISPLQHVAIRNHMHSASIGRAIQTAINESWRNTNIDTLLENYPANFSINRGSPTPTELIFFIYNKINSNM